MATGTRSHIVKVQVGLVCTTLKSLQIFSVLGESQPNGLIDYTRDRAIRRFRLTAESPMKITIKIHRGSF